MTAGALPADAERALRDLAPRVLGAVMRRCRDFAAAEDAVQDALLEAIADWPARGVPDNPAGWLFQVAWRKLADRLRSDRAREQREAVVAAAANEAASPPPDFESSMGEPDDDTLVLFFTCCHPALTAPSAIALTLRAVGGLTTAEIASAFMVPEPTMGQRISRAKQTIQSSGIPFELPEAWEREARLSAVMHVLYLVFNEGHTTTSGEKLVRVELAAEAIRLARALCRVQPECAEAAGLLSLMLLTDARRPARTGPAGELIPLEDQDRTRWDRAAIEEGTALLTATIRRGAVGSYQIQAAIAALHDAAPSTEATDWPQIVALYGLLRRMTDNPMVALGHAIASSMVEGPAAGLALVEAVASDPRIANHHRLDAVRAHLHEKAGDHAAAVRHYLAAAGRTASLPEKHYLLGRAARLQSAGT
jgi:RNA polymerase sigma factor (sigma-70 family)